PNQSTRCDYARARAQHGSDARDRSVLRGRRNRNNCFAAFGTRSAAQEVDLPANSAVELVADGIRAYLAREVHLQSGVDGNHVVVARDENWIVHPGCGVELK